MASYFQNIGTIVLTKTFSDTGTQKGKIISVFNGNLTKSGVYGELSFQELNGQALNERRAECYVFWGLLKNLLSLSKLSGIRILYPIYGNYYLGLRSLEDSRVLWNGLASPKGLLLCNIVGTMILLYGYHYTLVKSWRTFQSEKIYIFIDNDNFIHAEKEGHHVIASWQSWQF